MRTLKSSWIMFVAAGMLFVATAHAEIGDFDTPLPITSNDLARLMKAAGTQPQERPQVEAVFDNYVDRWQKLRDGTLRPLTARVAQLRRQQMRPMDDDEAPNAMTPEQRSQHWTAVEAEHKAILKNTAKLEAELCLKMSAAYKQIVQLEAPLFEALRAGERTPVQLAAIDREVLRRTRRRLDLIFQTRNSRLFGNRICAEILSVPAKGLDADTIAKIAARQEAYERQATPLLEQIAAQSLSETDEMHLSYFASKEHAEYAQMQMRAIKDIAAAMPKDVADAWLKKARAREMYTVLSIPPMPHREDVIQDIGERANPKVLNRLAQWDNDRVALEDQILSGAGTEPSQGAHMQCQELDKTALEELAQLSDTPSLIKHAYSYHSSDLDDREAENDFINYDGDKQQDRDGARRVSQLAEGQVTEDAQPQETQEQHSDREFLVRTLNAADVRNIHDRLAIAPGRRAVWDALAEDLLADTRAYAEKFKQGFDTPDDKPRYSVIILLMREQRTQQSRREEQWFDDLATTIPELPAQSLAVERARRACWRERVMSGLVMTNLQGKGNRWLDIDLDQAIESLKIAPPAGAPAAVRETLAAWRAQKLLDLQALVLFNETSMVSLQEGWRKFQQVPFDPENPMFIKLREAQTDYERDQIALCKRAADAQEGFIQAIASALTPDQSRLLQDALHRQMYPEVYRPLVRTNREIDRARAVKDASPEQVASLSSLADSFQQRFDPLADRVIKQLDVCEKLSKDSGSEKQTLTYAPWYEGRLALQSVQLSISDLLYDRDELVARTLRQVRSLGVTGSTE